MTYYKYNRRTILAGAAAGLIMPTLVSASSSNEEKSISTKTEEDLSKLKRVKVDLVAPPFVHKHEQIASNEPRIVEFTLNCEEKK